MKVAPVGFLRYFAGFRVGRCTFDAGTGSAGQVGEAGRFALPEAKVTGAHNRGVARGRSRSRGGRVRDKVAGAGRAVDGRVVRRCNRRDLRRVVATGRAPVVATGRIRVLGTGRIRVREDQIRVVGDRVVAGRRSGGDRRRIGLRTTSDRTIAGCCTVITFPGWGISTGCGVRYLPSAGIFRTEISAT